MLWRSGDREPVRVAGARVIPDGSEAAIELFARQGFLNVARICLARLPQADPCSAAGEAPLRPTPRL
jgi:hypothetical protein